jgi:hypothetical protein
VGDDVGIRGVEHERWRRGGAETELGGFHRTSDPDGFVLPLICQIVNL